MRLIPASNAKTARGKNNPMIKSCQPQAQPPTTRTTASTTKKPSDHQGHRTSGLSRRSHSERWNIIRQTTKPTLVIATSRGTFPQARQIKLRTKTKTSPNPNTPRRDTTANVGEICPSTASWYNIRGQLETIVAQLRRQLATNRKVTRVGTQGPHNT